MDINIILKEAYDKWKDRDYIYQKKDGKFIAKTFKIFIEDVYSLASYLLDNNLKDEKIIIYGDNSYELMVSDIAVTGFVGISVIVNKDLKEESVIKMIKEIDAKAVIYDDNKKDIVQKVREQCDVKYINMKNYKEILNKVELFNLQTRDENICSKIVFSSGTTGPSKGIMLSIKNIFSGYIFISCL